MPTGGQSRALDEKAGYELLEFAIFYLFDVAVDCDEFRDGIAIARPMALRRCQADGLPREVHDRAQCRR